MEKMSQRQMLTFWLPLAASWMLMSTEGPILQGAIARLPDMQTQIAAFGIVMSLEITIESPVIMLLATSTALATNARNYATLRNFMIMTNIAVTTVAALVAFTPLFQIIVETVMGIPPPVAAAARPGMKILTLWSAFIGWRRFYQGVLIRQGQTRWIGYGTLARLISSAGTAIALVLLAQLSGVSIAALALMVGVIVEALFVTVAAQKTVAAILGRSDPGDSVSLGYVAKYHTPLAATSLLTLLAQPVIGAGLARMPFPEENLAAWPIVWGILFIFRSPAFALPEVVLALLSTDRLSEPVRAFCLRVGLGSSAALCALVATPLLGLYLRYLAGLPDRLSHFVVPGLLLGILLPFLNSFHSWLRGLFMARRSTNVIYWGMALNLTATIGVVLAGVALQATGVVAAVVALILSILVEIYFLQIRSTKN
jgi:hypothetical protein